MSLAGVTGVIARPLPARGGAGRSNLIFTPATSPKASGGVLFLIADYADYTDFLATSLLTDCRDRKDTPLLTACRGRQDTKFLK
jgi:hypothetical protein